MSTIYQGWPGSGLLRGRLGIGEGDECVLVKDLGGGGGEDSCLISRLFDDIDGLLRRISR